MPGRLERELPEDLDLPLPDPPLLDLPFDRAPDLPPDLPLDPKLFRSIFNSLQFGNSNVLENYYCLLLFTFLFLFFFFFCLVIRL